MGDFEGFKTWVEEVTADVVEIARELELQVELKDMTQLLQFHNKIFKEWGMLLMDEQRKWFLEMESTPGEERWNDNKGFRILHIYTYLAKATAGFERTYSNFLFIYLLIMVCVGSLLLCTGLL